MTKEQVRLALYALGSLRINLDEENLDDLGLGDFEEVEQKIEDTMDCLAVLAKYDELSKEA
jgi:hypothetical protein